MIVQEYLHVQHGDKFAIKHSRGSTAPLTVEDLRELRRAIDRRFPFHLPPPSGSTHAATTLRSGNVVIWQIVALPTPQQGRLQ